MKLNFMIAQIEKDTLQRFILMPYLVKIFQGVMILFNAALNYGYSILLSSINRQVVSNGYITQIGIFHDNMFNQFNLSSDLIEPWRGLVDYHVYNSVKKTFDQGQKFELINLLNKEISIDNKNTRVNQAIDIYFRSVFDALNNRDLSLLRFPKYEL